MCYLSKGSLFQPLQVFFALQHLQVNKTIVSSGGIKKERCAAVPQQLFINCRFPKRSERGGNAVCDTTWHNYFQGSSLVSSDSPTPQTMRAEQSKHNRNWMCFPATTRCAALRYTDSTANASKTCKVTDSKTNCGWLVPSSSWRLYSFNLVWMITFKNHEPNEQATTPHPPNSHHPPRWSTLQALPLCASR